MTETETAICIENASLAYHGKVLFDNLNLSFEQGAWSCILGPSGVGKSSLLRMIAGLIPQNASSTFSGKIHLCTDRTDSIRHCHPERSEGSVENSLSSTQIAYMAQTDLLLPWLSVLDNTLLSHRLELTPPFENKTALAIDLLIQVGLKNAINKYPHELSGGMRQRVALVRTLIQDTSIVLMDEPFAAVDAITRFQLQTLAENILKNKTVILVTHDPMEALRLGHNIYVLSGAPATLTSQIQLTTKIPREPTDPELIHHHAELFHALTKAKECEI